jgi:hypothetical protein
MISLGILDGETKSLFEYIQFLQWKRRVGFVRRHDDIQSCKPDIGITINTPLSQFAHSQDAWICCAVRLFDLQAIRIQQATLKHNMHHGEQSAIRV